MQYCIFCLRITTVIVFDEYVLATLMSSCAPNQVKAALTRCICPPLLKVSFNAFFSVMLVLLAVCQIVKNFRHLGIKLTEQLQ